MSNISWFSHTDNEIKAFYIKSWNICIYCVYFKSEKELNYNRFVDLNILGASRLVHSDLRIYQISFFLFDIILLCGQTHNLLSECHYTSSGLTSNIPIRTLIVGVVAIPANKKHLYNIYITSVQCL